MEFWADAQRHSSRAKAKNHSLSVWILLVPIDVEKTHTVERLATQTAIDRLIQTGFIFIGPLLWVPICWWSLVQPTALCEALFH